MIEDCQWIFFVVALNFSSMGCATKPPTYGETLIAQGTSTAKIGEQWEQGQELVRNGDKLQEKGKKQIAVGEKNIRKGLAMVEKGRQLIIDSEIAGRRKLNQSAQ